VTVLATTRQHTRLQIQFVTVVNAAFQGRSNTEAARPASSVEERVKWDGMGEGRGDWFIGVQRKFQHNETKRKRHSTNTAPQAAYCSCSGTVHHTPRPQREPASTDFGLKTCSYMDYYSFTNPAGMECRVSQVDWPTADSLVIICQPQIGHRSGNVCRPKTDVLTTEPRRQAISCRKNYSSAERPTSMREF